ncbi:YmfQ family protein [Crenobacter cavernae]|uniref:DUF2313 domain-containing protein n=1 Tax=Crenobacter cavernae TaxID=2290923 RepID=A0A345Y6R0_9NEIS|nr:putative phage tail protein [Crenobacter cavernae]AXK39612.1 DUF2313 domain-containing protein [Crenobacter cavernae]
MALTEQDYARQLADLLPVGAAWPREPDSALARLLAGLAIEFALIDARGDELLAESDPRTTYEMLADWERVAGLPDECTVPGGSMAARRGALLSRLTGVGGQSRAYFIGIAAALGYPGATVTEFRPFHCQSACDDSLDPDPWRFVWRLNLPAASNVRYMTAESAGDEALAEWGDATIECVINRLKPAHTIVQFAYQE